MGNIGERPEPLVPSDVDLNDFSFMPLEVRRLLTSETWVEAADDPKVGHALISLWAECWHQRPAGSLPNNERVLAHFAMCTPDEWQRVRGAVMASWILCSDNLYYHPIVCEKVLESWQKKEEYREYSEKQSQRGKSGAEARWKKLKQQKRPKKTRISTADGNRHSGANGTSNAALSKTHMLGDGLKREGQGDGEGQRQREDLEEGANAPLSSGATTLALVSQPPSEITQPEPDVLTTAFEAYNDLAKARCLPIAFELNAERRAALRLRLQECGGIDGWRAALAKLDESSHCLGDNDRGWRASLDFILQKKSFLKLREGVYDDRPPTGGNSLRDAATDLVDQARRAAQ